MAQKEYLRRNKQTYDSLAESSDRYRILYAKFYPTLLKPFEDRVKREFGPDARVVDLGCGVGPALQILERHGFQAYGVDFSPKRVALARKNAPKSKVYVGNFVTKPLNRKFHGVMLISSFHLFPAEDVPRVLRRIRSLLLPGGYCLISIGENFLPKGKDKDEGYFPKSSAPDKIRFMTRYTRKAFKDVFKDLDWAKVSDFYVRHDRDVLGETWMNIVIRKTA